MTTASTRSARLAVLCLAALAAPGARAATGRDLAYGYTWRDTASGATYRRIGPNPFTDQYPVNNSAPIGPVLLGMPGGFPYYGASYDRIWISDNGWISFQDPGTNSFPTPSAIPAAAGPVAMLAPFWNDLDESNSGLYSIYYGPVASIGGFIIQWFGMDTANGQNVGFDLILFPDGRIQFQYQAVFPNGLGQATVGIESPSMTDGVQIAAAGARAPGVVFTALYAIEFTPPPVLDAECALVPDQPCGRVAGALPGTFPSNILYYGCGGGRFDARERVYKVTLAAPSVLDVRLTGTPNMRAFLMDTCSERSCLRGPFTTVSVPLGAGTYYVAVDATAIADEGPFTLDIGCARLGTPLACGSSASGTTVGGTSLWNAYSCTGPGVYSGTEQVYWLDVATATNLQAVLAAAPAPLDLLILKPGPGEITGASCVAWGDTSAIAWNALPGQYLLVVDGLNGASGTFDISTTCSVGLDCSGSVGTIDFSAGRVHAIAGDTTGGRDQVQTYSCDPSTSYGGPEDIWRVDLPTAGQITVFQQDGTPLSFFLLSGCNEGACVGGDRCASVVPAGTYWLVVDGAGMAAGPYDATVVYEESFNRWDACELPFGSTMLTDTSSPFWNLNDEGFCFDYDGTPRSHNYPNGCTFAMYVTVRCGAAMHLPLYDVEGGHLRIFDLLRGQYVDLTAVSQGGWFGSGTDIQWQDPDCVEGSDPRWNDNITDIYFERPEGLCGIFRLEFINHSGNVWELYANCLGDRTPGFDIFDSLCHAVESYDPLPNVSLLSATATYNCPSITVTYTIKNDGCATADGFPVVLSDGPVQVATDIVPVIRAGETLTRTFTATFPTTPTTDVRLEADLGNIVVECTEATGSGCNAAAGVDLIQLPGCSGVCQIVASVSAVPATICEGDSTTVDASGSVASLCPGGILEYQLRGPTGTRPWQSSPTFAGLAPATSADYDVDVRCQSLTTCTARAQAHVEVARHPLFDPALVTARDLAACNLGIVVSWSPATFYGTGRTGTYAVYRSETSCAAALAAGPVVVGLTGTSYPDPFTMSGATYYYVVEAEDATPSSPCLPRGPRNGGAVTRVPANAGACTPISDIASSRADLLPRIGGTLRMGGTNPDGSKRYGESFVDMLWNTDRPVDLLAGEHFHVERSDVASSGFTRITNDAPLLQDLGTTDFGAAQADDATRVFFYRAFSADSCENEDRTFDGGDR